MRMRLSIQDNVRTLWFEADMNGQYLETAAMNSYGFFGNFQGNLSNKHKNIEPGTGTIGIDQVFRDSLAKAEQIGDLMTIIGDRTVVCPPVPPEWNMLHNLFADRYGGSVILETADGRNELTEITGHYMVMTNFPVGEYKNRPLAEIQGAGDDRYRLASEYLEQCKCPDVSAAFDLLHKTAQNTDGWKTLCSMVFDPTESKVHFVMDQRFGKVFTVNIQAGTVKIPEDSAPAQLDLVFEGLSMIG